MQIDLGGRARGGNLHRASSFAYKWKLISTNFAEKSSNVRCKYQIYNKISSHLRLHLVLLKLSRLITKQCQESNYFVEKLPLRASCDILTVRGRRGVCSVVTVLLRWPSSFSQVDM